jgi:hypothetical protein
MGLPTTNRCMVHDEFGNRCWVCSDDAHTHRFDAKTDQDAVTKGIEIYNNLSYEGRKEIDRSLSYALGAAIVEMMANPEKYPPPARRWRVYFNCAQDFPVIWCVDNGTIETQIRLNWFLLKNIDPWCATALNGPDSTKQWINSFGQEAERPDNEPYAWIEFDGMAVFSGGGVTFYGSK